MSDASLWESARVKFNDMPTLQDALCTCDRGKFTRVLIDEFVSYDYLQRGQGPSKGARKRLTSALDVMRALSPDMKGNHDSVLFPSEFFALQGTSLRIVRRLGAAFLAKDDLPLVHDARAHLEEGFGFEGEDPFSHEYSLRPWEETLATRVWLAGPWCRWERYATLAAAFWEMTYLGFEYDCAHARMAHEKAVRCAGGQRKPDFSAHRGITISDVRNDLSRSMDLMEPDRFELDYRERLAQCAKGLNRTARIDLYDRIIDWEHRMR